MFRAAERIASNKEHFQHATLIENRYESKDEEEAWSYLRWQTNIQALNNKRRQTNRNSAVGVRAHDSSSAVEVLSYREWYWAANKNLQRQ